VTEPLLTQLKARSMGGFAALEHYPYAEVRQWVRLNLAV
jgi:ATP-dependent DNA helicase RecQ